MFAIEGFKRCDKTAEDDMSSHLLSRAKYYIDHRELFNDALMWLKFHEIATPGYSTLQKIISSVINNEETRLGHLIKNYLSNENDFLQLLNRDKSSYGLNALKKQPVSNKPGENKAEIVRHEVLRGLSKRATGLIRKIKLSSGNIRYFAKRCRDYSIRDLRKLKDEKALIYLTCFIATRFQQSNDNLTVSFMAEFKSIDSQAKEYRDEKSASQALSLAEIIEKVPQLMYLIVDKSLGDDSTLGAFRKKAFGILCESDILFVGQSIDDSRPDKTRFKWEYFDSHFNRKRNKFSVFN